MRVLVLTPAFHRERRLYARPTSPEDMAMRRVLRQLADERVPAPAPSDLDALRTPFETIWARLVPTTDLCITFMVKADTVEVIGVRPNFRAVR